MSEFEELAKQVLAIDDTKSKDDVIIDLKHTKSIEATINRIFDGQFLNGTERDPSLKKAFIILDSDEENENPVSSGTRPAPILLQDSSEADVLKSPSQSTADDRRKRNASIDFLFDIDETPSFSIDQQKDQDDFSFSPVHSTLQEDNESLPSFRETSFVDNDLTTEKEPPPLDDDLTTKERPFSLDDDLTTEKQSFSLDDELTSKEQPFSLDGNLDTEENLFSFDDVLSDMPTFDLSMENDKKKHDSDSDDLVSIPSMNDFFDELIAEKRPTPVYEIEDDEEEEVVLVDKKGKGKSRDTTTSATSSPLPWDDDKPLTAKERKKLEVEERKRKRAEQAEEKKRAKARLAEEKKRQKEQKEFEKMRNALFEKENRARTDRTDILKEMIVDVHPEFMRTRSGQLIEALFLRKDAEVCDLLLQQPNPKHTISWRRKCNSEWSNDSQTFIPLPETKITQENVVLVHVYTHEFVEYIQNDTVDQYIDGIQQKNPKCQIMLMLEGLDAYYKKKKLSQRRQFDAQIRSSIEGSSQTRRRKNDLEETAPEREEVEECLNYLQLIRNIMLVPTKDEEDTASWIESLTIDLGLSRYKTKNLNNNYKVSKCGTDPQDMYFKMLQEVQLCTPAVAKSIIYSYPTVQSLYKAYESTPTSEGELLLANLNVERSALHTRDRKINRVMSKKIYTIFTSDDPNQVIY